MAKILLEAFGKRTGQANGRESAILLRCTRAKRKEVHPVVRRRPEPNLAGALEREAGELRRLGRVDRGGQATVAGPVADQERPDVPLVAREHDRRERVNLEVSNRRLLARPEQLEAEAQVPDDGTRGGGRARGEEDRDRRREAEKARQAQVVRVLVRRDDGVNRRKPRKVDAPWRVDVQRILRHVPEAAA